MLRRAIFVCLWGLFPVAFRQNADLKIETVLHVNAAGPYKTLLSAKNACPAAPASCHIVVDEGNSLVADSITLGLEACNSTPDTGYSQTLELGIGVEIFATGSIHLLCGGSMRGQYRGASVLEACAGVDRPMKGCKPFPKNTPIVDMGDNSHLVDARVENLTVNCNLTSGCTGIRARGLNENSFIGKTLIENYLANGIEIDGTTVNSANFTIEDNQLAAWDGAGDGIKITNTGTLLLERTTVTSNSGQHISAAAVHLQGSTQTSMAPTVINSLHCEEHEECIEQDGHGSLVAIGVSANNGVKNAYHIVASATGSVVSLQIENNGNGECPQFSCIIKNDVSGRQISSTNPPASNGTIPFYQWQGAGGAESWIDVRGWHYGNHINQSAANGMAGIVRCQGGVAHVEFTKPFLNFPVIVLSDENKGGGATVSQKSKDSFDVRCLGTSDLVDWIVIGNPE